MCEESRLNDRDFEISLSLETFSVPNPGCILIKDLCLPDELQGKSILDIGGGASDMTALLLELGADAFAIDPRYDESWNSLAREAQVDAVNCVGMSECDLREYRRVAQCFVVSAEQAPDRYVTAFATKLPFPDEQFDIVCSVYCLTSFLSYRRSIFLQAMNEALRVAKPTGTLHLYPFGDWKEEPKDIRPSIIQSVFAELKTQGHVQSVAYAPIKELTEAVIITKGG